MSLSLSEKLSRFEQARERIKAGKVKIKLNRDRKTRIEELYKKIHKAGPVEAPIPNLFAYDFLSRRYADFEKFDMENIDHIAAMVWICKHQTEADADRILLLSPQQIDNDIQKFKTTIEMGDYPYYCAWCQDILIGIKKNFLSHQKEILQKLLAEMEPDSELSAVLE